MQQVLTQATKFISQQPSPSASGLNSEEARRRLEEYGFNELVRRRQTGLVVQFLRLFASPLMIILLIACVISAFVGDLANAIIIVLMVLMSVTLNFIQTSRSQRAAEQLRKEVGPVATVMRDGEWQEIPRREVVPGDVIRLAAGDMIPADSRLVESRDLHVQQAALTGESLPVEKEAASASKTAPDQPPSDQPDARDKVFLGTSVVSGTATAQVVATGAATAFGKIAERLAEKAPDTEFERGIKQFGFLITRAVIFLVLFVLLVNTASHRDTMESLLFAIALAVGLIPEFLPIISTVTLGQGALRMSRQKVIVKHLAAIQNFGSIDILCSDKTGTLTSGEVTLDQHLDPSGQPSDRPFLLAYLNSLFESGVSNPLDHAIRRRGANPLDEAILIHDHPDVRGFEKIDEIPFDFERRRVSVVIERDSSRLLITKGAPESVLAVCAEYEIDQRRLPVGPSVQQSCEAVFHKLSAEGYRVLAVAYAEAAQQAAYCKEDERQLVFAGFLTFSDQPLPSAAEALRALTRDGVKVNILTGDNELVAGHVCAQVGLNVERIVLGDEVDRMTDAALGHVAEQTTVFARVSPMQKNRIIQALKRRGHVVGYLGDGINDAPSLHTADVGISVATGTDVARDAAEIILLEQSLPVLHQGIIEGRKAFGNVMKYLLMGTSSNFGNMFSMAGASLFLPFLPMLPTQILLNNFLYDLAQVTIPTDRVDQTYIHKPHRWEIRLIRDFMLYIGPISSFYDFLTFFVLLKVFHASEQFFHTGWFVESLATQTLVIFIIRTAGNPLRSRPSAALTLTTLLTVLSGAIIPFTPLATWLGFVPLPATFFLYLIVATSTYLLFVEMMKRRLMKRRLV
ncbi:MAG: magnesium-translocating P-type ATPase [Acidobacteria bacterium]|nr:magnesium-translocating P-type ATPase [Acidobacteriota bacterium]